MFGSAEPVPPIEQVRDQDKLEEYYSYPSFVEYHDAIVDLFYRFRTLSEAQLLGAVSQLFNPASETLKVHLLPIGHTMGDAYVREDNARPEICVNLAVVARFYGKDDDERWRELLPVLEHELFHVYFARYRARSPYWQEFLADSTPHRGGQLILLDEGIAHFIGHRNRIPQYLAERRDGLRKTLDDCRKAMNRLASPDLDAEEAHEIILRGTVGEFFTKYLSISGMLGAYALFAAGGFPALRRCLEDLDYFLAEGMGRADSLMAP
jgi:hypothetical protein